MLRGWSGSWRSTWGASVVRRANRAGVISTDRCGPVLRRRTGDARAGHSGQVRPDPDRSGRGQSFQFGERRDCGKGDPAGVRAGDRSGSGQHAGPGAGGRDADSGDWPSGGRGQGHAAVRPDADSVRLDRDPRFVDRGPGGGDGRGSRTSRDARADAYPAAHRLACGDGARTGSELEQQRSVASQADQGNPGHGRRYRLLPGHDVTTDHGARAGRPGELLAALSGHHRARTRPRPEPPPCALRNHERVGSFVSVSGRIHWRLGI